MNVNTIVYIVWLQMKSIIEAKPLIERLLAGFSECKMRLRRPNPRYRYRFTGAVHDLEQKRAWELVVQAKGIRTREGRSIACRGFVTVFLYQLPVSLRIEGGVIVYLSGQIISLDWLAQLRHKQSWLQRSQPADLHHLVSRGRLLHVRRLGSSVPGWKCCSR